MEQQAERFAHSIRISIRIGLDRSAHQVVDLEDVTKNKPDKVPHSEGPIYALPKRRCQSTIRRPKISQCPRSTFARRLRPRTLNRCRQALLGFLHLTERTAELTKMQEGYPFAQVDSIIRVGRTSRS